MAFRGRTPVMSDDMDRSYDSSPDPLALSLNENTTMSARRNTPRRALGSTSPSKQNRRSSVSEMEFSSPSKAMILNTPRMGSASPWRIKVTVQAEPGSDEENERSPSIKRFTRTQTTTIPLKDPDAPAPIKPGRGRGRPKKSDVGSTPKLKRAGTPIKRAARSSSQDATMGAAESSAADIDTDAPPKRKRGRPRKNARLSAQDEDTLMILESEAYNETKVGVTPAPASKPKPSTSQKSTRFASPQTSVPAIETTDATPQPSPFLLSQDRRRLLTNYEMPIIDTPPKTELGARLRARKNTPHAKKVVQVLASSDGESEGSDVFTPGSGEENDEPLDSTHNPSIVTNNEAHPDPQSPAGSVGRSHLSPSPEDDDEEIQDATQFAFEEGTTRMPDDTTVMDSENFSMISVESLHSNGGPINTSKPELSINAVPQISSRLRHEYLGPSVGDNSDMHNKTFSKPSPAPPRVLSGLQPTDEVSRPTLRRYKTPVVDTATPSVPPVIEPVQAAPPKAETPLLGRVVTAGVALQGVLDPSRLTPEPSQKALEEKRDRLDDLFRGFSEGTRRDLQAGLRLGEQLAHGQTIGEQSSPARSSPVKIKPQSETNLEGGPSKTREPRLLTPEDQDGDLLTTAAQPEDDDVQYPVLDVAATERSLPSPARSEEDEMSWRVDTPPRATGNTARMHFVTIADQEEEQQVHVYAPTTGGASEPAQEDDYSDIWQEEASRSSNTAETDDAPQVQDLFEPGPVAPARGKLPRTWRRKSGNHFQYSDEAESPRQPSSPHAESTRDVPEVLVESHATEEVEEDEDTTSDASDDTGMFFQSNMPSIFSNRHSRELKQRRAAKLDLTMLLNEGESMVPESSPPVVTKKSSPAKKKNPFLNTPPRFPGFPSSPQKSSPLRRELRDSDISSESHSRIQDESSLPLVQSSPFHTYVDGESKISVASDQRQLFMEMEDVTDSSIRRVRNEADGYLDAYEPQERSLNEIEEVTEHSRTWQKNTSMVVSSPPRMKVLSPVRKRVPLFQDSSDTPRATLDKEVEMVDSDVFDANKGRTNPAPQSNVFVAPATELSLPQRPTGFLSRMTSSLWSAVTQPATATAPKPPAMSHHPILKKLTPLPKIEPWTKTHYNTLDRLYNVHLKNPALFSPHATPATPLSQLNAQLLKKFLAAHDTRKTRYIGAVFAVWGYEFDMSEDMLVICQVFCELMSLDSIEAYETLKGREIEVGDCLPGPTGQPMDGAEVARRLATVILGDEVRAAEKQGIEIDRSMSLEVRWA
ncbi:hypothetical protein CC86DRAFT_367244 [Ophiobolus disseminans]|uniref:Uncharacterized protein n=1 Tax=Ophiobolus disseminans TaxID=1469910 RepID=A0A6A7AB86_9PLEO|nr:hypothetical protein CC86DRAFT_367244 [Ophiobolus disseminans]